MRRAKDEITRFHEWDVFLPKRLLYFGTDVDEISAGTLIKNLLMLDTAEEAPISLVLNTPGGCFYNGLAIYGAIKQCRSYVTAVGYGQVMSMGPLLMQAADKRILNAHCRVMLHYGHARIGGNSKDVIANAREEKRAMQVMHDILLPRIKEKKPRFSAKQLEALLSTDTYLTAQEAVELGLADEVVE